MIKQLAANRRAAIHVEAINSNDPLRPDSAQADKLTPLFRTTIRRTRMLTQSGMTTGDMARMVKRRLADANLPTIFSPHSFRVCTLTDLLTQGVPLEDVQRLAFIRHARELGFPLDAVRELLSLSDDADRSCAAADAIARDHLVAVERRIARLTALKTELERMIEQCRGGSIADCHVIEVLADHSHAHCVTDHRAGE